MQHKRRRSSFKNKGLIICALIAAILCLWSSIFALSGTWDPLRAVTVTVSSPLTGVFDRMGAAVARSLEALRAGDEEYQAWQQEKKELEQQLAAQEEQLKQLQQLQLENEQLRDYLSLAETHASLMLLEARAVYTADTTGRLLTLDRGSRDGVAVGMPVLDAGGVLGVVCEVAANSCKVATLLDETVHIGVRNARSGVSGTLCGAQSGVKYCTLKYLDANIDREADLRIGDIVVTSGSGGNFPTELIVGRIVDVGVDAYDRSPYALVEMLADPADPSALLMIVTGEEEVKPEQAQPSEPMLPDEDAHPDEDEPTEVVPDEGEQDTEPEQNEQQNEPSTGEDAPEGEPLDEPQEQPEQGPGGGFAGDEEVIA